MLVNLVKTKINDAWGLRTLWSNIVQIVLFMAYVISEIRICLLSRGNSVQFELILWFHLIHEQIFGLGIINVIWENFTFSFDFHLIFNANTIL